MSKKFIDYSNTIIYKIYCKDENVKNIYVGHTTDFEVRKNSHKNSSKYSNLKIYKTIRENGGWDNWDMIEIAKYICKDKCEARIKEQQHYEILCADLNSCPPYIDKNNYYCSICQSQYNTPKEYKKHLEKNKHKNKANSTLENINLDKDIKNKFSCLNCDYKTLNKKDFNKHLSTSKHLKNIELTKNNNNTSLNNFECEICSSIYRYRSGLSRHKKVCKDNIKIDEETNTNNMIVELLKQNQELQKIIIEQNKEIMEYKKKNYYNNIN